MLGYNAQIMKEQAIPMEDYLKSELAKRVSRRGFFRKTKDTMIGDVKTLPSTALESVLFTIFINGPVSLAISGSSRMEQSMQSRRGTAICEELEKNPNFASYLTITAPVREELETRLIPSILLAKNWRVGIASSAYFAFRHKMYATEINENGIKTSFDPQEPLTGHFIGGLYLWNVFKNRGLLHSIVAHGANNSLILGAMKILNNCPSNDLKNPPTI